MVSFFYCQTIFLAKFFFISNFICIFAIKYRLIVVTRRCFGRRLPGCKVLSLRASGEVPV